MERERVLSDGNEAVRTIGFEISADGGSYVVPRWEFDSEPCGKTALLCFGNASIARLDDRRDCRMAIEKGPWGFFEQSS